MFFGRHGGKKEITKHTVLRRNAESRNKRPDTENRPDVLRSLPTLSYESLGWENSKIIMRADIWCDSSHSSCSLFSLVCRKKTMFRSWMRNKPVILQVPLFNYLLKPSNAQPLFIWLLYYLHFHGRKKKGGTKDLLKEYLVV